jgi:hypothetical protein
MSAFVVPIHWLLTRESSLTRTGGALGPSNVHWLTPRQTCRGSGIEWRCSGRGTPRTDGVSVSPLSGSRRYGSCVWTRPVSETLPITYVARHGETAWTLTGQHTGLTDLPLTERGERNARRLGDRLRVKAPEGALSVIRETALRAPPRVETLISRARASSGVGLSQVWKRGDGGSRGSLASHPLVDHLAGSGHLSALRQASGDARERGGDRACRAVAEFATAAKGGSSHRRFCSRSEEWNGLMRRWVDRRVDLPAKARGGSTKTCRPTSSRATDAAMGAASLTTPSAASRRRSRTPPR